ncbi:DUF4157 domain-containing protein [Aphanizomenon flos-aquae UKL13-PB]|nr:DUF4157 domain-containing protein [Aphanizomenon flos-aquae UKL13-PB]
MNNRQHIQKKHPSQSTYTPVQNLYQTRAFDIQQQPSHSSSGQENVDLDADHEQSQYNRYNLPYIPVNAPGTEPPPPIQTKLTIGQPGDKYEQEADQVASQVVQQINSPVPVQSAQGQIVQREEVPEEEEQVQAKSISNTIQREEVAPFEEEPIQAKSISDTIQREELPEEEEQVQAKSISNTIQREELPEEEQLQGKSLKGEMAATPNLETSIQGARGSGQPLDENIRQPMEKAFGGVDFSQVKVHNDAVSDQLNQSIQARAFTTGQDVFFRGGEYDPGSRGGQELIAHELTHVVQQGGASQIQRQLTDDPTPGQIEKMEEKGGALIQPKFHSISQTQTSTIQRAYLEIKSNNVDVVSDPSQPSTTVVKVIPINTRVVITQGGVNQGGTEWVKIRVTTGSDMGVEGWVSKAQLENRPETTQVTMQTAKELFTELAGATFETSSGAQSPIPFHYPVDGCYDRAHVMAQLLTEKGYASEKVFAISQNSTRWGGPPDPGLRVPTDYAGDNRSAGQQPAVQWWYHVAPIIKVRNDKGEVTEMVIDPSMTNQPITIDQWTGMMSSETFNRMTVPDIQKLLQENQKKNPSARLQELYPTDQPLTYTTDRNLYWPLGPTDSANPTKAEAEAKHTGNIPRMDYYSRLAMVHELAAAIRRELRATPINVGNIVNAINTAPPIARQELWNQFPVLHQEIQTALPNSGDMNLVENAVNKP